MTDKIPADKVREIVEKMHDHANHDNVRGSEEEYVRFFAGQLDDLLPAPPTLADMTEEERAACQWMQADTKLWGRVVIIVPDLSDGRTALLDQSGGVIYGRYVNVAPRPDLPRLEWPGDKKPAPVLPDGWRLADHKDQGRGVVTKNIPDSDGRVYFLNPSDTLSMGYDWHLCTPDELTYLDQGADQ